MGQDDLSPFQSNENLDKSLRNASGQGLLKRLGTFPT